jgi:hypothetical protein
VAKNDLATAKSKAAEYERQIQVRRVPFEVRQQHELTGLIALAEKRYGAAMEEFGQANQRDPRVLLLMARTAQGAGNTERAAALANKAAHFNELSFNFAYVKSKASRFGAATSDSSGGKRYWQAAVETQPAQGKREKAQGKGPDPGSRDIHISLYRFAAARSLRNSSALRRGP